MCTLKFTAASFTVANPKCPLMDGQMKKMVCIQNGTLLSYKNR